MREALRDYVLSLGVDDVGIASAGEYASPASPPLESLFPGVRSLVVLAFREHSSCESPSPSLAMSGRLDLMEFTRSASRRVTAYIEGVLGGGATAVPVSYPMDFTDPKKLGIAEVSLRHAAVAAALGAFGSHNLVVHPRFGTRVIFTAILTDLELEPDRLLEENPCTGCGKCVKACPVGALDEKGKTDLRKCLPNSQPHGSMANAAFWARFVDSTPEERRTMARSPEYLSSYQAGFIGFQYVCFRCLAACPVGTRRAGKRLE
ncbi:MAG: 4Fe-4S dicluster domain-containing protein [Deltaproteobacteria bacterium]|nr:4Fe-4S dicluster domain-containing protein [Deltaproteobacteria bacterium]